MRKRIWSKVLLLILTVCLLTVGAWAADGQFHAGLEITDQGDTLEVRVEDNEVLHAKVPTLTVPCGEKDWDQVTVTYGETTLEGVAFADGKVTFPVAKGGTYVIHGTRVQEPAPRPDAEQKEPELPAVEFVDVAEDQWYYPAVQYVCTHGMMSGVGGDRFAPEDTLNRAMVVQILYNMAGKPQAGKADFTDVSADAWYAGAVAWAAEQQVVNGVGDGTFAPEQPVTREQLAAILWRWTKAQGKDVSAKADLNKFADANSVSDYAKDALQWACGAGLINGMDGRLVPQGQATRAQAAAIFMRYAGM